MFAQLGTIVFQNIKGFTELSKTGAAVYAEHQLLDGKPRLQKTGSALDEVTLSIRFHVSFCNPDSELATLKAYRDEGEVLTLLYGNGKPGGTFVIQSIEEAIEDADSTGNVFSYIVGVSLKEYVTANRVQQEEAQYRKGARAVGNRKPVANRKENPAPCANAITALVTQTESCAGRINSILIEKGGIAPAENRNMVLQDLSGAGTANDEILARCADESSCAYEEADIRYRSEQLAIAIKNLKAVVTQKSYPQVGSNNQVLQAAVRRLKEASQGLVNKSILRNG